jgi:hypothetical protein
VSVGLGGPGTGVAVPTGPGVAVPTGRGVGVAGAGVGGDGGRVGVDDGAAEVRVGAWVGPTRGGVGVVDAGEGVAPTGEGVARPAIAPGSVAASDALADVLGATNAITANPTRISTPPRADSAPITILLMPTKD